MAQIITELKHISSQKPAKNYYGESQVILLNRNNEVWQ